MGFPAVCAAAMVGTQANETPAIRIAIAEAVQILEREIFAH
jgi:hypothetical protein